MTEPTAEAALARAGERLFPGARATTVDGALGTMALWHEPDGDGTLLGRLYVERATHTVFVVPTWAGAPAVMDLAVSDPARRSRLAVA